MSRLNSNGNSNGNSEEKRQKKEGTLVSAFIEQTAYDALIRHCEETGQSKTKAIERAIMKYCVAQGNE